MICDSPSILWGSLPRSAEVVAEVMFDGEENVVAFKEFDGDFGGAVFGVGGFAEIEEFAAVVIEAAVVEDEAGEGEEDQEDECEHGDVGVEGRGSSAAGTC